MKRPSRSGINNEPKPKTLLIDSNALLKFGYHGAKNEYNHFGEHIGGLYQFLTITRKLLDKITFDNVFAFWDGPLSGKLRYNIHEDYKSNRDKNFTDGTFSQDKDLVHQKKLVWNYLEQLCIKQLEDYVVESDDLIAQYCLDHSETHDIVICTIDRDMAQLISENVSIYFCDLKTIVNLENYNEFFKPHQKNALLVKILCGDDSDCIKGIKGLKETTLINNFPMITEREVTLGDIINEAQRIKKEREDNKKKPLQVIDNIIIGKTEGIQGSRVYEVNNMIMNLKKPLLTDSAREKYRDLVFYPLNTDGRSIKNIYMKMKQNGLDRLITENRFPEYFLPFKKIMEKEKEKYDKYLETNGDFS